jgi:hypothetical protein
LLKVSLCIYLIRNFSWQSKHAYSVTRLNSKGGFSRLSSYSGWNVSTRMTFFDMNFADYIE